ncbi:diheme cytochrome c [Leptothrix discophora]|uniref:Diheme cytochrome c n=1 Tax=Leptothrix discophora TaxID=89 RepID=A0ABT9G7J5_LEPDI|nr:diheme cytochrome c [Leptothrix discophora]MDP4302453.1 diheme cytochrome c [Leptothrix discophora]
MKPLNTAALAALIALGALSTLSGAARADGNLLPRTPLKAYDAECAACHIAYPPALLPAGSWARLMGRLDKHYGSDAALDPKTTAEIAAWLQREAGTGKRARAEPPEDRITRSAWFERKHDEVRADIWKRASVKSPANCAACHQGADRGDYDEDSVRIPR